MHAVAELRTVGAVAVVQAEGRANRYDLTPLMRLPVGETDQSARTTGRLDRPHQSAKPTATSRPDRHEGTKGRNQQKEPTGDARARTQPTEAATPPRKARASKPETTLPVDWQPTEAHRAFAAQHGLALELEVVGFKGHFDGRTSASWNGRFATWLSNQAKWNRQRGSSRRGPVQQGRYQPPQVPEPEQPDLGWLDSEGSPF